MVNLSGHEGEGDHRTYLQDNAANERVHGRAKNRVCAAVAPQHDASLGEYAEQVQHGARTLQCEAVQVRKRGYYRYSKGAPNHNNNVKLTNKHRVVGVFVLLLPRSLSLARIVP